MKKLKEGLKYGKRGITLIALVVTIVVLLILAGVTIATLTGNNGILTQANKAKEESEKAEIIEKIQLAAQSAKIKTKGGEITEDNIVEELNKNIGEKDVAYTIKKEGQSFLVTYIDSNMNYLIDLYGNVTEEGKPGNRYEKDTDISIGGGKISVPGGATISKIPGEYEDIDKGIVIYIIPEAETVDWEKKDKNGVYEVQKQYDQFVWVPVKNSILDLSKNETALISDDTIKSQVQKEIDAGRYPMAIKKDAENYCGILYDFTEEDGIIKVMLSSDWKPTSTNSGIREPDISLSYDSDVTYLNQINGVLNTNYKDSTSFKTDLQEEFNTMVKKVENKGGFWVGRYETSQMSNTTTETYTKSNEIQVGVKRGTTTGINNVTWYRMYAQQKAYKNLALTQSANVISSMIWGSQWDQIMIWMKEIENKSENSYYIINSLTMGNFGITGGDTDTEITVPAQTGNSEKYNVKNIFDLAGNVREWTLECNYAGSKVNRGSYYNGTNINYARACTRTYDSVVFIDFYFGSRIVLY